MTTDVRIWLMALMTLGLYSYLFRENPFFRFCEHAYTGLSLAHLVVMGWTNVKTMALTRLANGEWATVIPIVLGVLLFARWFPKAAWLSRYPIAYLVGTASGVTITGVIEAGIIAQVRAAMKPVTNISSLVTLLFTVAALSVFFFIVGNKPEGQVGSVQIAAWRVVSASSYLGRLVLMVTFGAVFGSTVMARLGLFIPRLELLFRDWIHLIR
ncbi:MAG: hypothetical protein IMF26_00165 [Candidatus Fermentithermobacillus carboniphilus]|uniref:Uncharacterized protein n=1 Tax=Candidatus Fermentithermobacillus carboniphilus TaxID=3085328 RepID=A0AAT9LBT3_9FIRM|nr:MAG: hypothetical protein IMF26_00165 [Candidatus Fermentithermobacillus carboniphilus]